MICRIRFIDGTNINLAYGIAHSQGFRTLVRNMLFVSDPKVILTRILIPEKHGWLRDSSKDLMPEETPTGGQ